MHLEATPPQGIRKAHSFALALALSVALGIACSASSTAARDDVPEEIAKQTNPLPPLSPERVKYFEKQFLTKCARCHGKDGTGSGPEAAEQPVPPANLTDAKYMNTRSDGQLFYQILMGGGAKSPMPAFGPDSSQGWSIEKVWEMVRYVRTFSQPLTPTPLIPTSTTSIPAEENQDPDQHKSDERK